MFRRLGLVAVIFVAFTATAHAAPRTVASPRVVYIQNQSTVVSDAELANALPAFQAAVSEDLNAYWNVDATLVIGKAPQGEWRITIRDYSPSFFAEGWHDIGPRAPYALVFAATAKDDGTPWTVTFTHELFEMLVDPYISRMTLSHGKTWLTEVGDPCENDHYYRPGQDGQPVYISDFITPAWYRGSGPTNGHGEYDFDGRIKKPNGMRSGGYAYYWDGSWEGVYAKESPLSGAPSPRH